MVDFSSSSNANAKDLAVIAIIAVLAAGKIH